MGLEILATHMANSLWNDQEDHDKIKWANWESICSVNTMGGTQYWGLEHVAKIFDQEIGRGRWEVVEANYRLLSLT